MFLRNFIGSSLIEVGGIVNEEKTGKKKLFLWEVEVKPLFPMICEQGDVSEVWKVNISKSGHFMSLDVHGHRHTNRLPLPNEFTPKGGGPTCEL